MKRRRRMLLTAVMSTAALGGCAANETQPKVASEVMTQAARAVEVKVEAQRIDETPDQTSYGEVGAVPVSAPMPDKVTCRVGNFKSADACPEGAEIVAIEPDESDAI